MFSHVDYIDMITVKHTRTLILIKLSSDTKEVTDRSQSKDELTINLFCSYKVKVSYCNGIKFYKRNDYR